MTKDSTIELQKIDCNCNDCKYLIRDFEKYKSFNNLYKNERGQVTSPSHRVNYGGCERFKKVVSFIPNTCQIETQNCFEHRRAESKIKEKSNEVYCPDCESKVKLKESLDTDWYGNLKYYLCKNCMSLFVSKNGGELEIAARRI